MVSELSDQVNVLTFYLVFFVVALVLPTVRIWRKTGINPVVLPNDGSAEGFAGNMFKLLIAALGIYLAAGSLGLSDGIGRIFELEKRWIQNLGWVFLISSLFWIVIAQFQMGESWRVGNDRAVKTKLVKRGLFNISRNPVFLGMMVQICGLFLVLPDAFTSTTLFTAFVLISVQIRLEEAHLTRLHGPEYLDFCKSVRRWL